MVEELLPFTASHMESLTTVVDLDDLKQWGQFSDQTLDQRYFERKNEVQKASPPIDPIADELSSDVPIDLPDEVTQVLYGINSVEASNNWAIHGNHTTSGKPLLGGDPHLGCKLPAFWQMMELSFTQDGIKHSVIGGSIPGVPAIIVGNSINMAWSTTSPHTDNSDLWQERLSEDGTKYKVDGEWRDLVVIESNILVKG